MADSYAYMGYIFDKNTNAYATAPPALLQAFELDGSQGGAAGQLACFFLYGNFVGNLGLVTAYHDDINLRDFFGDGTTDGHRKR